MFRRLLLITLFIGLLSPAAPCSPLDSTGRADFQWFSKLGFPNVKGCRFVRAATGGWTQTADGHRQTYYMSGFLLATNANTFTIFTPDLITRTLRAAHGLSPLPSAAM